MPFVRCSQGTSTRKYRSVKLLFDENLSPRLPALLKTEFPGSTHLRDVGQMGATDAQVWEFARANGFMIVSKDNDFRQRSFLEGAPPKVVWLSVGNSGTEVICNLLRAERARLASFDEDSDAALLVVALT